MSNDPSTPAAPATPSDSRLARGQLGSVHVVFFVLAAAAPMAVVVALVPIAIAFGVGTGTPLLLLLAAGLLLLFAVGYVRAVPHVQNAGAFYAYITQGLGRPAGLVAAYIALACYNALSAATCGGMAFFAAAAGQHWFGIDLPWWVYAAIAMALILALSYRKVTLTARVLGVALVLEVGVLSLLILAILFREGASAFSFEVFSLSTLSHGALGVGVIYAVAAFMGFEGTAIYAEETHDPVKTVPRATYAAIAVVGVFYVLCVWAMIAAIGTDDVSAVAAADPGNFVLNITNDNLGSAAGEVLGILVVTSAFAAVLAFHNAAARYFYALARDGFLPAALARTHPRFRSPHAAGTAQIVVVAVIVICFALAGLDPLLTLSTAMTGVGTVGLESLLALTSLSIATFFWKRGERGFGHVGAPILASIGLATATVLSLVNYSSLTGSTSPVVNALPIVLIPVALIGIGMALWARSHRPDRYERMGQTRVDEVDRDAAV